MKARLLVGRKPVFIEDVSEVVIFSDDGHPVSVTSEQRPGVIVHSDQADADFENDLKVLGIRQTGEILELTKK